MRDVLFGLVALAAVTSNAPAYANGALYRCSLNIDVVADYTADTKSVTLYVQGQKFQLPIALSGSGARYSDGKTSIWEHHGEATFETPGASFTGCTAMSLGQ
jgi:membrane-bound inhibitor of C-type lysozyme